MSASPPAPGSSSKTRSQLHPCPFVRTADVVDLARDDLHVIDLRSPSEFADDHVPGAINVPLLNDMERAVVGTLYKQASPNEAFARGLEYVVAGVTELVSQVARATHWDPEGLDPRERVLALTSEGFDGFRSGLIAEEASEPAAGAVVLHCWRGGMRSMSVVALLRELGLDRAVCLEGGYKAYRRGVLDELAAWTPPSQVFVLRGLTGVGKTVCLREIERLRRVGRSTSKELRDIEVPFSAGWA